MRQPLYKMYQVIPGEMEFDHLLTAVPDLIKKTCFLPIETDRDIRPDSIEELGQLFFIILTRAMHLDGRTQREMPFISALAAGDDMHGMPPGIRQVVGLYGQRPLHAMRLGQGGYA